MALPISRGMASPHEFATVYGLEDAMDMLELVAVENFNSRQWSEWYKNERR